MLPLHDALAAVPPDGCIDAAVWRLAHGLHMDHCEGADGSCARCGGVYPCLGQRLAQAGLATALGEANTDSDYWTAYARVLALHAPAADRAAQRTSVGRFGREVLDDRVCRNV
jgi:hypothetical protein